VDTAALVRAAKRGDREALVRLIMKEKQDYYRLAYAFTGNRADALDAMEDMIVILHENIRRLRQEAAFPSWSRTILVNCCKSILRQRKQVVSLEVVPETAAADSWQRTDEAIMLERQLTQLGEKQQEVLRLRYYLDLDYQTIAGMLKIPLGTVKSRLAGALRQLQKAMEVNEDA